MPIIAVCPPASCAGAADDLPRRVSKGIFEFLVDGRVIEAAVAVGTVATEVVFVAEFAVGDAILKVSLLVK